MSRAVPEWIGTTPDTAIPPRVRARVIHRAGGCCEDCSRSFSPHNLPEIDHHTALISGGENRESNLRALCRDCHGGKTRVDVAEKSTVARKRAEHFGFIPRKHRHGPVAVWCRSFDSIMCSKGDELWAREERMNSAGMQCELRWRAG